MSFMLPYQKRACKDDKYHRIAYFFIYNAIRHNVNRVDNLSINLNLLRHLFFFQKKRIFICYSNTNGADFNILNK